VFLILGLSTPLAPEQRATGRSGQPFLINVHELPVLNKAGSHGIIRQGSLCVVNYLGVELKFWPTLPWALGGHSVGLEVLSTLRGG
jgi:hypothetical protein